MKMQNQVKITFASRSVNEGFARAALAAFLVQLDPTVPQLADLKTAVSEAVTNCIVHAYPDAIGPPSERAGLGFAVMQSFMDKVRVSSTPGRGTRVTLTKRLEARD